MQEGSYWGSIWVTKNPMAAKETNGDGGSRKYANSQFSDQDRQDAISRASAVQNSARGPR